MIGFPYPPTSGGQLRDFNLIKEMSKKFKIDLVIHSSSIVKPEHFKFMESYCNYLEVVNCKNKHSLFLFIRSIITRIPYKVLQYTSTKFYRRVSDLYRKQKYDILFCDHIYLTNSLPRNVSIPVIPHTEDSFFHLYKQLAKKGNIAKRLYATIQWKILFRYEIKIYRQYGIFIAVSKEERDLILKELPEIKIPIVPNGIDLDYYSLQKEKTNKNRLTYLGLMDYLPNEDAAMYFSNEILPLIKSEIPEIEFYIVGKNPTNKVLRLGKAKGITVTGPVEDVRSYIAESVVFVVPLRMGTGTRFKILEAMSTGIPVVSTSIGCEGIKVINNQNILIADTPGGFSKAIKSLINDKALRDRISCEGRKVAENYSWDSIGADFNNFLISLIKERGNGIENIN
jgi:glycosyltransferase involved in cell wall biosynthesis